VDYSRGDWIRFDGVDVDIQFYLRKEAIRVSDNICFSALLQAVHPTKERKLCEGFLQVFVPSWSFILHAFRMVAVALRLVLPLTAMLSFAQPSGEQILKNIEANYAGIHDYTVTLDVAVDLERLKVPKMKATMYFKQPDKIHFVSEGFALLPKEGLGFTPGRLSARFEVANVEAQEAQYYLTMTLKNDKAKLRKAFFTVNASNWTVTSITTPQFDGREMKAAFSYQRIDGYWLPATLIVTFTSDTTEAESADPFAQMPGAIRSSQLPRRGSIAVRYSDYKINTGLSDEVFEEKVSN
jgi:outer membrane lipoprotein-sorting protein